MHTDPTKADLGREALRRAVGLPAIRGPFEKPNLSLPPRPISGIDSGDAAFFNHAATTIEKLAKKKSLDDRYVQMMAVAAYFKFDGTSMDLPDQEVFAKSKEVVNQGFFLPFPTVAVHDKQHIVIVQDTQEKQVGLRTARNFLALLPTHAAGNNQKGVCIISGRIHSTEFVDTPGENRISLHTKMTIDACLSATTKGIFSALRQQDMPRLDSEIGSLVCGALKEIAYFNLPSRFVVELKAQKPTDLMRRVQWQEHRSEFTMLTPKEIAELAKRDLKRIHTDGEEIFRAAHYRRKHERTFHSECYRASGIQGTTMMIPAVWVGPSEFLVQIGPDQRKYVVHTNL